MTFQPLVSVIVPVYNVEKYLPKCAESIIEQTYRNLEIILVDDGATDASGTLCDQIAETDDRIIVIHKKNGGLSDARNAGIAIAKGEYFSFVDSDDYIDKRFIEILMQNMIEYHADISISNYERVPDMQNDERKESADQENAVRTFSRDEALDALFRAGLKYQFTTAWGKVYARKVIGDIRYPKGRNYEDTATTHRFIANAEKVVYTDRIQYYYLVRQSSITKSEKHIKDDAILAARDRMEFFQKYQNAQLEQASRRQYVATCMGTYARIYGKDAQTVDRKKKIYQEIKEQHKQYMRAFPGDYGFKLRTTIFLLFPLVYQKILEMKKG